MLVRGALPLRDGVAFGDLTLAETMRSTELFATKVIPGFRAMAAE